MTGRAILHVDMDAFFASVEQRDNPVLRGRPVVVGGAGHRGVVAAASYEARRFGVRSAMPAAVARRLCPAAVIVPARHRTYREVSGEIFAIFREFTDIVEGLSLDEAFLDVSGAIGHPDEIERVGRALKNRIATRTGLTASVGMAGTKLVAKLASAYDKPDGFVRVRDCEVRRFLDPLPVGRLPGVGPSSTRKLNDAGILTVGQLRRAQTALLERIFGARGREMAQRAAGIDPREVDPVRVRRSISQESTFEEDLHSVESVGAVIDRQADQVAASLVRWGLYARTVHLKLRSAGFSTLTRSRSLDGYTRSAERIAETARGLLEAWAGWQRAIAIRLVGVGVSGLESRPFAGEMLEERKP